MREDSFEVFKGLQSPLVFKGFKGKYIYWGLGLLISSFLVTVVTIVTMGYTVGIIFMAISLVGGLFFLSQKQKKGLYSKNKTHGVYINRAIYKFKKYEKEEQDI